MSIWNPEEDQIGAELPPQDQFSGLDPRVAEHMRKRQAAQSGLDQANMMSGVAGIADVVANNSREPSIYHNRMQDLGQAPKVTMAPEQHTDLSGLQAQAKHKLDTARSDESDAVKMAFEQKKAKLAAQVAAKRASSDKAWKIKNYDQNERKMASDDKYRTQSLQSGREERRLAKEEAMADKLALRDNERTYKAGLEDEKVKAKRQEQVVEVEDRRTNIKQNLAILKKMIAEDGTYEMFGSHNQDLDRMVEQVATDMAKLSDPQSVARPSEVEAVKKNLVQSGFQNTNGTADDLLTNFEKEVDARADTAYKIRGLPTPSAKPATPSSTTDYDSMSDAQLEALLKGQ